MRLEVAAIFKDEAPNLREWLAFHRLQGATKFWLYDNGSTDNWREVLDGMDDVYVQDWPGQRRQMEAYWDCIHQAVDCHWLATLDIDEYLWTGGEQTVKGYLAGLNSSVVSQVIAPWRMFGDGGHETRPEGLTTQSYQRAARGLDQRHGKPIIVPSRVWTQHDPHSFALSEGQTIRRLVINHYWTRSVEECRAKFARTRADTGQVREWREFTETRADFNEVFNDTIWNVWGEKLEAALA